MHLPNGRTITPGLALVAPLVSACYLSSLPASRSSVRFDRGGLPRKTQALPRKARPLFDHGSVKVNELILNNYSKLPFKFHVFFVTDIFCKNNYQEKLSMKINFNYPFISRRRTLKVSMKL